MSPAARAKLAAIHLGKKHTPESRLKMSKSRIGLRPSKATRKKMSEWQIGKKLSQATKDKIAASLRGRKLPQEVRRRISLGHRGYKHTPEVRARMSAAQKGKVLSAEHRRKLSAAKKGQRISPETRRKISLANKGRKHTPEELRKMSEGLKRHWARVKYDLRLAWKERGITYSRQFLRGTDRTTVVSVYRQLQRINPERLIEIVNNLPPVESAIIKKHFGIEGEEKTIPSIAAEIKRTVQETALLYEQALEKVKRAVEDQPFI